MTPDDAFLIPDDVLSAHLGGEAVVLDMEARQYYRLNESAATIWKELERGATRHGLVEALCRAYVVDAEEARHEVDRVINDMIGQNLLRRAEPADGEPSGGAAPSGGASGDDLPGGDPP